jgi:hypothetical protein
MAETTYPNADASLMLDLTRARLTTQLSFVDAIDAKTGTFLGWSSGLIAIYAAFLALRPQAFGAIDVLLLGLNLGAYSAVAYSGLRGLRPYAWATDPPLEYLWGIYEKDANLKWRVADDFYNYYDENQPQRVRKENYLGLTRIGLIVQTVTTLVGIALS